MATPSLQDEVRFITGFDENGNIVTPSFWSWDRYGYDVSNGVVLPFNYPSPSAEKWGAAAAGSGGGTVKYYFNPASSWSVNEQGWFTAALSLWSAVANISFVQTTDQAQAQITFTRGSDHSAWSSNSIASTATPNLWRITGSTVSIDTTQACFEIDELNTYYGYGVMSVIHEIGHSIGLGHAGVYNGSYNYNRQYSAYDTHTWSLMSYLPSSSDDFLSAKYSTEYPVRTDWHNTYYPGTPMQADILAIQRIYGTPTSTPLSGGQVFGFNCNITGAIRPFFDFTQNTHPVITIWDAGTGNTIDLSGFSMDSILNLNPGSFSSCAYSKNNLCIAEDTQIDTGICGNGNDTLIANSHSNTLNGGSGTDMVSYAYATAGVSVNLSLAGAQSVGGGKSGPDTLISIENLTGSDFADMLFGTSATNTIIGGGGSDLITGGSGNDVLNGGSGADTAVFSGARSAYTITANGDGSVRVSGPEGTDTLWGIEQLQFSDITVESQATVMVGSSADDVLHLAAADAGQTLNALAGNDDITAATGTTIDGGDGNDILRLDSSASGAPVTMQFSGASATLASAFNGIQFRSFEHLDLTTGAGNDTVTFNSLWATGLWGGSSWDAGAGTDTVVLDLSSIRMESNNYENRQQQYQYLVTNENGVRYVYVDFVYDAPIFSLSNVENFNITGCPLDDMFAFTTPVTATLDGGRGDDVFDIRANGTYVLAGGEGSDWLQFDSYPASSGVTVNLGVTASQAIGGGVSPMTLSEIENVVGTSFGDTLTGDAGDNIFVGSGGTDTLSGGAGSDTADYLDDTSGVTASLVAGTATGAEIANDILVSIENLWGGSGNDTLTGDSGDNYLYGYYGDNMISAGAGNDVVVDGSREFVGRGNDSSSSLDGGAGDDLLVLDRRGTGTAVDQTFNPASGSLGGTTWTGFESMSLSTSYRNDHITFNNPSYSSISGPSNWNGWRGNDTATIDLSSYTTDLALGGQLTEPNKESNAWWENWITSDGTTILHFDEVENFEITAGSGNDVFVNYRDLYDPSGNDTFDGGAGINTVDCSGSVSDIAVDFVAGTVIGDSVGSDHIQNIQRIIGGKANDTFIVNNAVISIDGREGQNAVDYRADSAGIAFNVAAGTATGTAIGTDELLNIKSVKGGSGNDTFRGGSANETFDGGAGSDTVDYSGVAVAIHVNLAEGTASGSAIGSDTLLHIENVIGGSGNDVIDDSGTGSTIDGGAGLDTLNLNRSALGGDFSLSFTSGSATPSLASDGTSIVNIENLNLTTGSGNDHASFSGLNYAGTSSWNAGAGNDSVSIDLSSLDASTAAGADPNLQLYWLNVTPTEIIAWGASATDGSYTSRTVFTLSNVESVTIAGTSAVDVFDLARGVNYVIDGRGGVDEVGPASGATTGGITVDLSITTAQAVGGGMGSWTLNGIENLWGSQYTDHLTGNANANTFYANWGNDTYSGGGGTDTVSYWTAPGGVTVSLSTTSAQSVGSGLGSHSLISIENLVGSDYADTLYGNSGDNVLTGRAGNDMLNGYAGADTMIGGTGDDAYYVDDVGDVVTEDAAAGNDAVRTTLASYTLGANVEYLSFIGSGSFTGNGNTLNNIINGGSGNDALTGGGGTDTVRGNAGDDIIFASGSASNIDGGSGNDTLNLDLSSPGSDVTGTFTSTSNTAITGSDGASIVNVETFNLTTGAGNDDVTFGGLNYAGGRSWDAGVGNDTATFVCSGSSVAVSATAAVGSLILQRRSDAGAIVATQNVENYHVFASLGDDYLYLGAGDDTIYGSAGNDTLCGGTGANLVDGGDGNDAITVWGGINTVIGGSDTDTLLFDHAVGGVTISLAVTAAQDIGGGLGTVTVSGVENLWGTLFDDVLTGDTGDNALYGSGGDNTLEGGAGNDTLNGGSGTNTAVYSHATGGVKVTLATSSPQSVGGGMGTDTLLGIQNLIGSDYADSLSGDSGVNVLSGGAGNDTLDGKVGADAMIGGTGDDLYYVDDVGDVVTEDSSAGNDTVRTTLAAYTMASNVDNLSFLGSGDFTGNGNALNNIINGGSGDDTLDGGAGADTMRGGAGDDTYFVDTAADVATEATAAGNDSVRTTLASYTLGSNLENVTFTGSGNFTGNGNALNNVIVGGSGNDTLDGKAGLDAMFGGAGDDCYYVDSTADFISEDAGAGNDVVRTALASYSLGANIESLSFIGSGDFVGTGNDLANIINGGSGNDNLDGGAGADTMRGGAGNDNYLVDNAGDVVTELTGSGNDEVTTTLSSYTLGANVECLIFGGSGNFSGNGNELANIINGGSGNDTLNGRAGADTMVGGTGDDCYYVDNVDDFVGENSSAGNDVVRATSSSYTLSANVESLTFIGYGDFSGTGNDLANIINGGSGNDILDGAAGADTMRGGAGNDAYYVDSTGDVVTELTGAGTDEVRTTLAAYTLGANVENLVFAGAGNFKGNGNGRDNIIAGGSGNDTLNGYAGADMMAGGAGDDVYVVDNIGDVVSEDAGAGNDVVRTALAGYTLGTNVEYLSFTGSGSFSGFGNDLANIINGGSGNDTLNGEAGADTMRGGGGDDFYYVDNVGDVVTENASAGSDMVLTTLARYTLGANVEILDFTGTGNFTGNGNALSNSLYSLSGNDTLDGKAGADLMAAGAGDDVYYVDNALDSVCESADAGNDTVRTTLASYVLAPNVENLSFIGSGVFSGLGNELDNVINGGSQGDILDGAMGADTMRGGAGDDLYFVDNAGDLVTELANGGTDRVLTTLNSYRLGANVEGVRCTGNGDATATGNALNNEIITGSGNDTLQGGAGADALDGGLGANTYVYTAASDSTSTTYDTITRIDFSLDRIALPGGDGAVVAIDSPIAGGTLSSETFDADLALAMAGNLGSHHAMLFTPDAGTLARQSFLVVDMNGMAGYQSGTDLVVNVPGYIGTLAVGGFV